MKNQHDRLDSQFNVVGAFWAPEKTEVVRTGTLSASPGGISFTTAPEYSRRVSLASISAIVNARSPEKLPVLHGFTESGLCTLCDLFELERPGLTHFGLGQSVAAVSYRVFACITGMHLGGSEHRCLTSARFTFLGLTDWLPKAVSETWDRDSITLRIPLEDKEVLNFSVRENRTRVKLKIFSEFTGSLGDGSRISKSVAFVEIESAEPESMLWYYRVGNRLENLFSLLTGASLALDTFFVYRGDESGHVNVKRSRRMKPFDLSHCIRCNSNQLAGCIATWLSEPPEFIRVEDLALGTLRKAKLFVETEFLSLAQALEGVHRATNPTTSADRAAFRQVRKKIIGLLRQENVHAELTKKIVDSISHANEPSFVSRLRVLCQGLGDPMLSRMEIDPETFASTVVAMRNFYTHTGGRHQNSSKLPLISGKDLFLLSQKMRAVLRGTLLIHLGLRKEQIVDVLALEAMHWR